MTTPNQTHEQLQAELQLLRAQVAALEIRVTETAAPHLWIDELNDAVILIDAALRIREWNRGAEQIYGWGRAEAVGQFIRPLIAIIRFADEQPLGDTWEQIRQQGAWRNTFVQRHRDGRELVIEGSVRTLRDEQGEVTGYLAVNRDVTSRFEAEQALRERAEQLSTVTDAAHVGLVMVGQDNRYRYANRTYIELFQLPYDDIVGMRVADALPAVYESQIRPRLERAFTGELIQYVLTMPATAPEQAERFYNVTYSQSTFLDQPVIVVVLVEVTERRQLEARLRDQAQVLNQAQVLVRDMQNRITLWTHGAEQLYGFSRAEALGQVSHSLLQTEFPEPLDQIEAALAQTGRWSGTLAHRTRAGAQVFVASQWLVDNEADGRTRRIVEANTDITEQVRAEAERERAAARLRILADASRAFASAGTNEQDVFEQIARLISHQLRGGCMVGLLSDDGNWLNTVALYHYDPAMAAAAEPLLRRTSVSEEATSAIATIIRTGQPVLLASIDYEGMLAALPPGERARFQRFPLNSAIGTPLRIQSRVIGALVITRHLPIRQPFDQADLVLVQELADRAELAIENARLFGQLDAERALLARRVDERTTDLSVANAELERAVRLKDEFLANMSHELRTPLNAILGRSEVMREELYGPVTERQQVALQSIEESGRHLLALINDILDLSKIEAGKLDLEIEEVLVDSLCRESVRMVAQIALSKRIALSTTLDGAVDFILADVRRIKQILVNLLSNAVKFTPEGGKVGLEVRGNAERQQVMFTVWDTGIGIAADDLDRLFQPFTQLDSSLSRQHEGTGLGLALVRRLVEAHGGSVSVESAPGRGSRFDVTLAWSRNRDVLASPAAPPDPAPTQPSPIGRVLVIEDSISTAAQLTRYLTELGATVETHPYGIGAVERALLLQPDVILLDILLPNESGWEVLRQLKAHPHTQSIPVVIVSVLSEFERGRALGAAAYLVKPVLRDQLVAVLRQLKPSPEQPVQHALIVVPQGQAVGPLILLAEDNEANIVALEDYLPQRGYRLVVARNGLEAIARAREFRPALILMDIQMPGIDGLEATRRIRADAALRDTPIIALTALAMSGDRERCLEAGANDYLTKPVSLRTLLQVIAAQLQRSS